MIHTELIELDSGLFKRTYSDTYKIRKVGTEEVYDEAYDVPNAEYEYEETNELLPPIEEYTEFINV